MKHPKKALRKVLESNYDITEHTAGNYQVIMKYDGYSAMCTFNYLHNQEHVYTICRWDSLNKTIKLPSESLLSGSKKSQVISIIRAIQSLGYDIEGIEAYMTKLGQSARYRDVTYRFNCLKIAS